MRNFTERCNSVCSYNLVCNFLDIAFAITKFSFCGALFKRILAWERGIFKRGYQLKLFLGVKICFHSSRYENQKFPLVQYSCRTGVVRVAFVLHSCHSCLTRSCRSCRTRVARVWHSCCKIDQINSSEQMFLNEQLIKENLKLMNHNISNVG